ncbi:response regulator transcription factor [Nonomuraea zeae]|uniref:Response regulator transcription factor n=1 Tax=Nonomuraea zeae TaxID=1642303 RepID=A0A5S4G5N4_9ACTN|nr:response regulator transcription factor [Nonomuraea zeae]TMR27731.1 response regulator transcription factor [Nonomuraea zeae]
MIRVLIAEDVRILREALATLLGYEEDMEIVAEVSTGDAIVPAALAHRPDVAVLDIDLPVLDGLAAAAELHERLPGCRVLILTALGRPGNLRRGVSAHVSGFMLKDARPRDLVNAIREIAAGGRVIDQHLAYAALDMLASPLTEREADVLRLTGAGAAPRGIAKDLNLSYGTVRNYLASAVTKLNARTRSDAVRIATEAGWL